MEGIFFTKNREGRRSGDAYIELDTLKDVKAAMKMNKKYLGDRYVEGNILREHYVLKACPNGPNTIKFANLGTIKKFSRILS